MEKKRHHPRITLAQAKELAAKDPRNAEKLRAMEERDRRNSEEFLDNARPILEDLRNAGCFTNPPDAMLLSPATSPAVVNVLIRHLNEPYITNLRESIIRALHSRVARGIAAKPLVEEYHRLSEEKQMHLRWVIGNTLSYIADDSVLEDIAEIVKDKDNGNSRFVFIMALARMKDPRAVDVLIDLLDEQIAVPLVVRALRRLKAAKAKNKIVPLLSHPDTWIRKEAQKFVEKF